MENQLISIIVPVYNVEEYLKQCLDSILEQTFSDYEVILVNDGSTDNSGLICQEYAEKDSRIRYFEKENGGLSDARNYGIEQAQGEYLTFVDSDDFLDKMHLNVLYTALVSNNVDISIVNYANYQTSNATFYLHTFGEYYEKNYSSEELLDNLAILERNDLSFSTIWGKLYKRSVFSFLRFPKGVIGEDVALIYKIYTQVDKIVYAHKDTYIYRENDSGITKSKIYPLVTAQLNHIAERLALLAIMGYDVTKHFDRYITFLKITEYNMRMIWGMEDTETYRHIKENLILISQDEN
ncbi:glycosyltransferase, group 2 family protein [Streptococcus mitis SK575]|uniref:Glycosyltransferase, group 2 family protein n=1 Tax=Streptococcus mitis SK575 TaxID=1095736 RepID=I0T1V1_STRMT|nr:glycosyltransferase family 2 protein [Streptococcus mitis]EID29604.1 glycosyltransferase, group 2 family protein [Streptococcus mitis SK575]